MLVCKIGKRSTLIGPAHLGASLGRNRRAGAPAVGAGIDLELPFSLSKTCKISH